MAAFFAASVQAPVTGTILIMEMTSSYDHLLVLCIASMVALVSARLCKGEPIYDSLLYRLPEFKKTNIPDNERRNVVELTVESGSSVDGKSVGSISCYCVAKQNECSGCIGADRWKKNTAC